MTSLDDFGLSDEQLLIRRNVAELLARVLPARIAAAGSLAPND